VEKNLVNDLFYKDECYKIIGLCIKIHNKLGKGFKEIVYKDALEFELQINVIPYEREKIFNISYEQKTLLHKFCADFFVFNSIILEIKSASFFHESNFIQTLNYLKAAQVVLGIVINFGEDRLKFKRIVSSY
jgi:GxxExxY protein